jgi:HemK-related putative methylase
MDVYMPREDSHLLEKEVLHFARGSVLDMGAGSGVQAKAAASLRRVKKVLAVDRNKRAVEFCKKTMKNKKIRFVSSDLFKSIPKQRFDTIIFNPPYLPEDKIKDIALEGGKKGHELLERFLNQVNSYLAPDGILLIVFSSLTNRDKIDEIIRNNMLEHELLDTSGFFFERLFVYKIVKSNLLKELEKKKISSIRYFSKGKRGIIFTGSYKKKKIAIKAKHPKTQAQGRIENEAKVLNLLNKYKIGPRFIKKGKDYLIYDFVEGDFIKDWLPKANKFAIRKVLKEVLVQCDKLDRLKLNKEEMHRPFKHIIIGKCITMIDFERTHKAKSPKNVTQFLQYIRNNKNLLNKKGLDIRRAKILDVSKKYKFDSDLDYVLKELGL